MAAIVAELPDMAARRARLAAAAAAELAARPRAPVTVRSATIADVYPIAARMRPADAAEARALGRDPRVALRLSFRGSLTPPRVAELAGQPIAMWGLGGLILSDVGAPWLVTTRAVELVPVTFVRIARAEVAAMLAVKPRLENTVIASYTGACRLLEVLGFRLGPPVPLGPRRTLFRTFTMER